MDNLTDIEPDSTEKLRIRTNHSINHNELQSISDYIQSLIDSQKYYSVLYILEDVFREENLESALARMGKKIYYRLYTNYALAAHQQSTSIDCKKAFENIYENVCESYDPDEIFIAIKCSWELYMIQFENLQYNETRETRKTILKLIQKMNDINHIEEDIGTNYYARRSYLQNILADTDSGTPMSHAEFDKLYKKLKSDIYPYLAESFRARYAVSIVKNDPEKCIELLNKGKADIKRTYGVDDKHYQWCEFYHALYSLIYYKDERCFQDMLNAADNLRKNQAGNYRKKLFAISSLYYSRGQLVEGNRMLLKNELYATELRNRYKAFFYETTAIHSLQTGKTEDALRELSSAINILSHLPDYSIIPKHNKKVIASGAFSEKRIKFLFGNSMEDDVYYLDPRIAW